MIEEKSRYKRQWMTLQNLSRKLICERFYFVDILQDAFSEYKIHIKNKYSLQCLNKLSFSRMSDEHIQ